MTFLFPRRSRPPAPGSATATPTAGGQTPLTFGAARNLNRLNRLRLHLTGHPPDARSTIATTIMDEARAPAEKANPSTSISNSNAIGSPPPTTTTTASTTPATTPTPTPTPGSIALAGASDAQGQPSAPAPPLRHGHELPFVAPSSYLRPKPPGRDMTTEKKTEKKKAPLTALDKEQLQGLVSTILRHTFPRSSCPSSFPLLPLVFPRDPGPALRAPSCGVRAGPQLPSPAPCRQRHRLLTCRRPPTERYPRVPQSANQL